MSLWPVLYHRGKDPAQKAIPALHQHVQSNAFVLFNHSVRRRIDMTIDMRSSGHEQGCYIFFTTHLANLLLTGKDAGWGTREKLLLLPHILHLGDGDSSHLFSLLLNYLIR